MKSLIECVGLCNADSAKCNSVFFMKQNNSNKITKISKMSKMCNVYIKDVSSKMKSLIECVGLCNAESTKCNSVFFMKQNLICKLANLLSYKVSNTNKAMSGELAYIQTSKL